MNEMAIEVSRGGRFRNAGDVSESVIPVEISYNGRGILVTDRSNIKSIIEWSTVSHITNPKGATLHIHHAAKPNLFYALAVYKPSTLHMIMALDAFRRKERRLPNDTEYKAMVSGIVARYGDEEPSRLRNAMAAGTASSGVKGPNSAGKVLMRGLMGVMRKHMR